ncbi:MAG: hypothetical protein WD646_10595 [Actinomycetota bacterium]
MRKAVVGIALASLSVGPWLGLAGSLGSTAAPTFGPSGPVSFRFPRLLAAQADDGPVARRAGGGCTCRSVVVNATNEVRDADIESGDAEVRNSLLTYIAPGFEGEVEIEQEAEAISGDAIAGQIIAIDAGDGCANVIVKARNVVEDADVESGDAIAKNKSVVLFDPSVDREVVDLDIDQDADAESGVAMAGQVIGVSGGGGPCGGVDIDALNDVRDVDLETGRAVTDNDSKVQDCDASCMELYRSRIERMDAVQVCDEDGCETMSGEEFLEYLDETNPSVSEDEPVLDEAIDEEPAGDSSPSPSPSPDPAGPTGGEPAGDDGAATPSPSPTPTPQAGAGDDLA